MTYRSAAGLCPGAAVMLATMFLQQSTEYIQQIEAGIERLQQLTKEV